MRRSLLILLLALVASLRAAAYDFESEGIYYEITGDDEVTVTTSGDPNDYTYFVEIPEFVEHDGKEYMVTAIAPNTFVGCEELHSVMCPRTLRGDIRENFLDCPNLHDVVLEGDMEIDGELFMDCPNLAGVHFGRGVRGALPLFLFFNCPNLTWIDVAFDNPYYDSRNGCNAIIETATNTLIKGCTNTIIPEGVTAIGDYAFVACFSLESIDIPEGVTAIGDYAFVACLSLTSINLPESLTTIGAGAFEQCSSLTSINLPESLTAIGDWAFCGCSSLESIDIPESVTAIGERAFYACPCITEFQVADGNPVYAAVDGVMFNKEKTAILHYPAGRKDETYTIPEGVTAIGYEAFSGCENLTSVTIPEGVTAIGYEAFEGCSSLESIDIPESVTTIGARAFYACSSLMSIKVPESVTTIGAGAFYACSSLMSIKVPESLTTISENAFNACPCITEFQVADGNPVYAAVDGVMFNKEKTAILHYPAGRKDETYTIPEGVTAIGNNAFHSCSSLATITLPESLTAIGGFAFYNCSSLTSINLPESLTAIGIQAFAGCSSLATITLHSLPTSVGRDAIPTTTSILVPRALYDDAVKMFPDNKVVGIDDAGYLEYRDFIVEGIHYTTHVADVTVVSNEDTPYSGNITIPATVTYDGLTYNVVAIGNAAFYDCSNLTSINLPESLTTIDSFAFCGCSSLESITLPESLTTISFDAFYACPCITEFQVADGNPVYAAVDGVMFNKEKTAILHYPAGRKDETYTIPEGVTSIGFDAFSGCENLTSVTIPEGVTAIGYWAFRGCSSLATITLHSLPTSVVRYAIPTTTSILVPRALYDAAVAMFPNNTVVCETDLNTYDHILYTAGAEIRVGDYGTVDFALKNANPVTGFQFDLTLPEGITFATDEYGDPMIEIVEGRTNAKRHAVTWQEQPSGAMRILCTSMSNATFTGNDGAVLRLTLRADKTLPLGTYDLAINKMIISQPDNSRHHIDYAQFPIDVVYYTFGDLDGDNDFTVSDVTATVNFILNTNTEGLDRRAADLNRDGEVTITDAVAVINLVLGSTVGSSHRAPAAFSPYATLSIADFSIAAGQSIVLPVRLAGCTDAFSAMQFDLMLPEGLSLVDVSADRRHQTIFARQANGAQRIVALSTANATYTADADVLFLTLAADDAFTGGTVTLDAIELASPALATFRPEAASALAIGTAPTALEDLQTSKPEDLIYDLQGRRTSSTATGVVVKHGQKIVK